MGRLKTITRRSFLVASTAIIGGVAFGTYSVKRDPKNPLDAQLTQGEASFNPWVKIGSDGITLITPHADIGQGVRHVQALLLAEELDIDLDQFETDFGVPSDAYWNREMGAEGAPFLASDHSFAAETTRSALNSMMKVIGLQATGGSSSSAESYVKLRAAGASARETLKLAAAQRSGVSVEQLTTRSAAVHLPDGSAIAYSELAQAAAKLKPVHVEQLRDPSQWRLLGKPSLRVDIVPKSTGTLEFGIDLRMQDMLYATVKTNPHKGGALISFDDSKAKSLPGVKAIIEISNGVAVIADNTWHAFNAINAVEFEWGDASYPANMDEHWQAVRDSFSEQHLERAWRDDGDVENANNTNAIEAEYKAPYVAHQPLEPLSAVMLVGDDRIDLWTAHQMPGIIVNEVARITEYEKSDIYFHNQYGGGSFGHRLEFEYIKQLAQIAQQHKGIPIKLTYRREEDFAQDFSRQISMARGKGSTQDGKVTSCDLSIASVSVVESQIGRMGVPVAGPDIQIVAGAWNMPYGIENLRVSGYRTPALAPVSSWRSVGASSAGFFAESFLDELIHSAGADPLEERLRLANTENAKNVLQAISTLSNWGSDLGPNRSRGIACVESFGVTIAEVVEISNTDRGIKIDKVYVVAEVGKVLDAVNFDNQIKGGVIWGLGHAMNCEITYAEGVAEQSNFHQHTGMRMNQCPEIIVKALENGEQLRGIGEPPVPPAAPALANAIFALNGQRIREMPFNKHIDFV